MFMVIVQGSWCQMPCIFTYTKCFGHKSTWHTWLVIVSHSVLYDSCGWVNMYSPWNSITQLYTFYNGFIDLIKAFDFWKNESGDFYME